MTKYYLLVLLGFLSAIFLPVFFIKFEKVECVSINNFSCSPEANSLLSSFVGKGFFDIYAKSNLFFSLPFVSNYSFKLFPLQRKVLFRLEENKIIGVLQKKDGSIFLVDSAGSLIEKSEVPLGLAVVKVEGFGYEVSNKISDDLLSLFRMLSRLQDLHRVEKGIIYDDKVEVFIKDGPILILPRNGNPQIILGRTLFLLDSIINHPQKFKLDKSVTYITIDLRYKNPVLK